MLYRDEREKTNQTIFDMFMACHSQEEIAEVVGIASGTVANKFNDFLNLSNLAKNEKTNADHEDSDFQIPLYNVWTKSKIRTAQSYEFLRTSLAVVI